LANLARLVNRMEFDHTHVSFALEGTILVEYVSQASAHPGGEVAPGFAKDDHQPASHVLASMVSDTFDYRGGAAVAYGEALAGKTAKECLPAGGAVECNVADEDVFLGLKGRLLRRGGDHGAARQPFAAVVVRFAFQIQGRTPL